MHAYPSYWFRYFVSLVSLKDSHEVRLRGCVFTHLAGSNCYGSESVNVPFLDYPGFERVEISFLLIMDS